MATQLDRNALKEIAIQTYKTSRNDGLIPWDSAQAAWMAARKASKVLRAPWWNEVLDLNTSCRRSYRSPLGEILGVGNYSYGSHAAGWPRTKKSEEAGDEVVDVILSYLESL